MIDISTLSPKYYRFLFTQALHTCKPCPYCVYHNTYLISHCLICRFGGYLVAGLHRKFLELEDTSFSYYERPATQEKAPTVLFLHGFTGNKTMWMIVSRFLPKSWRIVVLDMPGHGESSFAPNCNYSTLGLTQKIHDVSIQMHTPHVHTGSPYTHTRTTET